MRGARLQVDLAFALLIEEARADLRSLGVEQDGDVLVCGRGSRGSGAVDATKGAGALSRRAWAEGSRLLHAIHRGTMRGVVAVAEVQPGSVHAGVDQRGDRRHVPAGRAHGAENLRLLVVAHGPLQAGRSFQGRTAVRVAASPERRDARFSAHPATCELADRKRGTFVSLLGPFLHLQRDSTQLPC